MNKIILALASTALIATTVMAETATAPVATPVVAAPASTAVATKVKMKIKAKEKNGLVKAKVAISHDMLTYDQAKRKNKEVNFITHITATVGETVVYDVSTSQFLSKNPLIKFQFTGKKGDELKITYTQLKGEQFFATKKIK